MIVERDREGAGTRPRHHPVTWPDRSIPNRLRVPRVRSAP